MCLLFQAKTDSANEPAEELLGSLTTYNAIQKGETLGQTVRTSARVFKKMRQDSCQQQPIPGSTPLPDVPEKKGNLKYLHITRFKCNGIVHNVDG